MKKHINCLLQVPHDSDLVRAPSLFYPSLVQSTCESAGAFSWYDTVIRHAHLIQSGDLDDQLHEVFQVYEKIAKASQHIASLDDELQTLAARMQECDDRKLHCTDMIRWYKHSNFDVNLWDHYRKSSNNDGEWRRICCPKECHGFVEFGLQDDQRGMCCACNAVICEDCHVEVTDGHICADEDIKSVERIKSDSKQCPVCLAPIHRLSGCKHMHCTRCRCNFDWMTGKNISKEETTNVLARLPTAAKGGALTDMVEPCFKILEEKLADDPDAIGVVRFVSTHGLLHKVIEKWGQQFELSEFVDKFTCVDAHGIVEHMNSAMDNKGGMVSRMLVVITILCGCVATKLRSIQVLQKLACVERYKFLCGKRTVANYMAILYQRAKEESLLDGHVSLLCRKVRELVDIIRPGWVRFNSRSKGRDKADRIICPL